MVPSGVACELGVAISALNAAAVREGMWVRFRWPASSAVSSTRMRAALVFLLGLTPAVVLGGVVPGLGASAPAASTSRAWDEGPWRPAWVLGVANLTVRVLYESGESDETLASRACSMASLKAVLWASAEPTSEASCVGAVRNALLVARRPRVGYWRQLSTGTWVPIDLLKGATRMKEKNRSERSR